MNLVEAKINATLVVKEMQLQELDKLRLMELGLIYGTKIIVKKKSFGKKNLLVNFENSCFTIGCNLAEKIMVEYV